MDRPTLDDCIAWADAIIPALKNEAVKNATLSALRRLKAVEEALTPSAETKAAYISEFQFRFGPDHPSVNVPWTTIKQIMAAIRHRATLTETPNDQ